MFSETKRARDEMSQDVGADDALPKEHVDRERAAALQLVSPKIISPAATFHLDSHILIHLSHLPFRRNHYDNIRFFRSCISICNLLIPIIQSFSCKLQTTTYELDNNTPHPQNVTTNLLLLRANLHCPRKEQEQTRFEPPPSSPRTTVLLLHARSLSSLFPVHRARDGERDSKR